jgi:hypothetical protein
MNEEDAQKIWSDYFQRKKAQRLEEAAGLWRLMRSSGVNDATVLALDFTHFGKSKDAVEALADQLSENYEMNVISDRNDDYWYAEGTTRPEGITLSEEQHIGWVEFMADVAHSYACVFSTWSLESPSLGKKFESKEIEINS